LAVNLDEIIASECRRPCRRTLGVDDLAARLVGAGALRAGGSRWAAAGRDAGGRAARGRTLAAHVVATAGRAAFTAAQQLHLGGHDVGGVLLHAVLVGVLAGLQAPFHVDRATLLEVFTGDLGHAVEEGDAVPFGFFLALTTGLVLPLAAGRHRDVADGRAAGQVAHLGILAEVADDDDFVDRGHGLLP
jgi:hypothetical protein